uniref:Histone-lysine N-methyltransferase SETMAR n=2 Tax=Anas TaxID=8835 RepID=A0A493T2K1_ANAPP
MHTDILVPSLYLHSKLLPLHISNTKEHQAKLLIYIPQKCIARVHPAIVNNWRLHHDTAPSHTAFRVVGYLAQHKVATLPQPPYSPDLAPPDFFLFLRIKLTLKGKHHASVEALQEAVTRELNSILVQAFLEAYENWKTRWQQCVDAEGCYFEKF